MRKVKSSYLIMYRISSDVNLKLTQITIGSLLNLDKMFKGIRYVRPDNR